MRIADICTRHVIHIPSNISLREAASTMRSQQVGALIVVEQSDGKCKPVGIITDRDIVVAAIAEGLNPDSLTVADVMATSLVCCSENADLFEIIALMRLRGIRRIPVLDADDSLAGLVTADDIIGAVAEHLSELARAVVSEEAIESRLRHE